MPPLNIGGTSGTRGTVCTLHRVNIYAGSVDWGTYNGGPDWLGDHLQNADYEASGEYL